MGIIWSPFSNLLLYNETLQIEKAIENGVLLALGSDWLPTGSKGPLEEMKVALEYITKKGLEEVLKKTPGADSAEEALFKMVTENPAKMINHWQNGADASKWQNGEDQGGVGTITKNAMATFVITTKIDKQDPYKNIVKHVWESDINLVVIDGKIQYGNEPYLRAAQLEYDLISENDEHGAGQLASDNLAPVLFHRTEKPTKDQMNDFLDELSEYITVKAEDGATAKTISCEFKEAKGFVTQNSLPEDKDLLAFEKSSGLNLDRFRDIQRLISVSMITQSRNRNDPEKGDPDFAVKKFTPLYTCNDEYHSKRVKDFINFTWIENSKNRLEKFSDKPEKMARDYQ